MKIPDELMKRLRSLSVSAYCPNPIGSWKPIDFFPDSGSFGWSESEGAGAIRHNAELDSVITELEKLEDNPG